MSFAGWNSSQNPNNLDEEILVNPNSGLEDSSRLDRSSLTPEKIGEEDGWDIINDSLESPKTTGIRQVGLNLGTGLIGVYEKNNATKYVLGAIGDQGSYIIIDEGGNVSNSSDSAMPVNHRDAVLETLTSETDVVEQDEAQEMDVSLGQSATEMYKEIIDSPEYEALDGDVVYKGFNRVEAPNIFEGDEKKASRFLEFLDDIAEFYRDFEEEYNPLSPETDYDIPVRPKAARNGSYKFAVPDTGYDFNVVVDQNYKQKDGKIELQVNSLGDHDGPINQW